MTNAIDVLIDNSCDAKNVPDDVQFRQWATAALRGLRTRAEVSIGIVDEQNSAALNQQYREKKLRHQCVVVSERSTRRL